MNRGHVFYGGGCEVLGVAAEKRREPAGGRMHPQARETIMLEFNPPPWPPVPGHWDRPMRLEDLRLLFKDRYTQLRSMAEAAICLRRPGRYIDPDELIQRLFVGLARTILKDGIELRDATSFTGYLWVRMKYIITDILKEGPGGRGPKTRNLPPDLVGQVGPDYIEDGWTTTVREFEEFFLSTLDQALIDMTDGELQAYHASLFVAHKRDEGASIAGQTQAQYDRWRNRACDKVSEARRSSSNLFDNVLPILWREEKERRRSCAVLNNRGFACNGYDLRLISWGDGSGVPTAGKNLIIVGTDNKGRLHIRMFYSRGIPVTDTDETKLPSIQAEAISALKQQLPGLIHPRVLTDTEKAQVIAQLTSIVGQTPCNF